MGSFHRRRFLAGGAALATFTIVPRHVLGGKGFKAPSDKPNIAGIGVAGMGAADLRDKEGEQIVALCDVNAKHAADAYLVRRRAHAAAAGGVGRRRAGKCWKICLLGARRVNWLEAWGAGVR
jgi:hypothetical protein